MAPCRFHGVEPRTCAGQVADDEAHALGPPRDLPIGLEAPVPPRLPMGRGIKGRRCRRHLQVAPMGSPPHLG
jgi:hypothetical protein